MLIVRTIQSGFTGGPGYTDFHFASGVGDDTADQATTDAAVAAVRTFWSGIQALFPTIWTAQIDTVVRDVNPITGSLILLRAPTTAPLPNVGSASVQTYAAPAGAIVQWATNRTGVHGLVRGRTFLVPICTPSFDAAGKIAAGVRTMIANAGNTLKNPLVGGEGLVVWHRPRAGGGGYYAPVTAATCSQTVAVLTSRRV